MNDDTLNTGENPQADSLTAETTESEVTEASETAEPTGEERTEEQVTDEGKKGANARIRELAREKNEFKAKAESLADQMAKLTSGVSAMEQYAPQPAPTYQPPQEEQVVTREQYEADMMRKADAIVQLRLQQQSHITRVNQEANAVISKYEQLNPDSDKFDRELSETLTDTIMRVVKSDPTASVKKIAESFMKPYQRSVEKQVGEASEEVAKQATQAAMRPTASSKKEDKSFSDLSVKEMEKRLEFVQA